MPPFIKVDSLEVMLDEPTMFELHREGGRFYVTCSGRTDGLNILDRFENPSPKDDSEAKARFNQYVEEYRTDQVLDAEAVIQDTEYLANVRPLNGPADNTGKTL